MEEKLFDRDSKEHFVEWKEDEDTDEFSEDEEDEICSGCGVACFCSVYILNNEKFHRICFS